MFIAGGCLDGMNSVGAKHALAIRITARFAPTELLIWFSDWNYKHSAPTERYNRIDTQSKPFSAFQRLSANDPIIVLHSTLTTNLADGSAAHAYPRDACLREASARRDFI